MSEPLEMIAPQADAALASLEIMVTCTWHLGEVPISQAIQNGNVWKCRRCYATERGLQKTYKDKSKAHVWRQMSTDERRAEIRKNADNSQGAGRKRSYEVRESTAVTDSMKANSDRPFLNCREPHGHIACSGC